MANGRWSMAASVFASQPSALSHQPCRAPSEASASHSARLLDRRGHDGGSTRPLPKPPADRGDRVPLVDAPPIAHRTRAAVRQHAIDDDLADGMPARVQRAMPSPVSATDSSSGSVTQMKASARGSRSARADVARLRGEQRDQPIGRFGPPDARELLPNQAVLVAEARRARRQRRRLSPARPAGAACGRSAPYRRRSGS